MQFINLEGLYGKIGLRSEVMKSGAMKDIGSPSRALTAEERAIFRDINRSLFERFVAAMPDWDHSAWEKREVIHSGPDKVHIDTRFIRYRADGSVLASFDSLYIVTKQDGRWGVVARSSFAP